MLAKKGEIRQMRNGDSQMRPPQRYRLMNRHSAQPSSPVSLINAMQAPFESVTTTRANNKIKKDIAVVRAVAQP